MMKNSLIAIRELSIENLPEIVTVHVQSFPTSANTRLGREAVRRYYEWLFIGPHQARYLGAWMGNGLGGFCICGKFKGALIGFLLRNKWYLASQVLIRPWLLANKEVRSAVMTALTRLCRQTTISLPSDSKIREQSHFGVLALATSPYYRRLGLGAQLMEEVERVAHQLNYSAMGLTVSPSNEVAIHFYTRLGWIKVNEGGQWKGRMVKFIRNQ